MTLRRTLVWISLNAAVVVAVAVASIVWLGPFDGSAGMEAAARGDPIPFYRPLLLLVGALAVANLAWLVFVIRKR